MGRVRERGRNGEREKRRGDRRATPRVAYSGLAPRMPPEANANINAKARLLRRVIRTSPRSAPDRFPESHEHVRPMRWWCESLGGVKIGHVVLPRTRARCAAEPRRYLARSGCGAASTNGTVLPLIGPMDGRQHPGRARSARAVGFHSGRRQVAVFDAKTERGVPQRRA